MRRTCCTPCWVFLVALALGSGGGFGCDRGKDQATTPPASRPAPPGGVATHSPPKGVGGKLYWDLAGIRAIEVAIDDLGLLKECRGPDGKLTADGRRKQRDMTDTFRRSLSVEMIFDSPELKVISVSFVHKDPKMAKQFPDLLAKNYLNAASRTIIDRLIHSKSFLEKKLAMTRDELAVARSSRDRFELKHAGMYSSPSALQDQILAISTRIDVLRGQQRMIENKLPELEQAVADYEARATTETQPVRQVLVRNEERDEMVTQLEDMKERLQAALESMTEKHPTISAMRKQIRRLEERIAEMPEKIVKEEEIRTGTLPDRRGEYEKGKQDLAGVLRTIKKLEGRLKALESPPADPGVRREYESILDRVQEKEKAVSELNQRLRSVRAILEAELADRRTRMRVVQPATAERVRTASGETVWRGTTRFEIRREDLAELTTTQPAGPGPRKR